MCIDMPPPVNRHVDRHVYRSVNTHVYHHVNKHVSRRVCRHVHIDMCVDMPGVAFSPISLRSRSVSCESAVALAGVSIVMR